MSTHTIAGIHHVTAIAGDPQGNLDFYTRVLGLRLVKLTVNFDDPGTYHLYFGNDEGTPGSILTFFPWPRIPRGTVGNGQVSATAFAVPVGAIPYWAARLTELGTASREVEQRFGEPVIQFVDPDGLPGEIIGTAHADPARAWSKGPVPAEHAICGFHSATLSQTGHEGTAGVLERMGFRLLGNEANRYRYVVGDGPAGIIDVLSTPEGLLGRLGAGTVHHIAFRTPDDDQQRAWRAELSTSGHDVSPIMDRTYFHSIYFREPGGVLFEIATDPPGFATDETREHLGERLMLPAWLESHRADIERRLPSLTRTTGS
jgi:glyoxalase family protein